MGLPHKGLFRQGAIVIESFRIDGRELQIFAYSIAMMTEQEFIKSQLSQVPLSECNRINSMNLWVGVEVLYALDIHNNERLSGHFIGEVAEGLGGVSIFGVHVSIVVVMLGVSSRHKSFHSNNRMIRAVNELDEPGFVKVDLSWWIVTRDRVVIAKESLPVESICIDIAQVLHFNITKATININIFIVGLFTHECDSLGRSLLVARLYLSKGYTLLCCCFVA